MLRSVIVAAVVVGGPLLGWAAGSGELPVPGVSTAPAVAAPAVQEPSQLPTVRAVPVGACGGSQSPSTAPEAPTGGQASSGGVNLNTATAEQLDALPVPGLGAARSRHVVEYRQAHGPYTTVAQLGEVPGLPAAVAARLGELVTV